MTVDLEDLTALAAHEVGHALRAALSGATRAEIAREDTWTYICETDLWERREFLSGIDHDRAMPALLGGMAAGSLAEICLEELRRYGIHARDDIVREALARLQRGTFFGPRGVHDREALDLYATNQATAQYLLDDIRQHAVQMFDTLSGIPRGRLVALGLLLRNLPVGGAITLDLDGAMTPDWRLMPKLRRAPSYQHTECT